MKSSPIANRLTVLRKLMAAHKADYYFVPSTDPHRNEYLPECFNRRSWISGFTGSAGDILVGKDNAYLWTDPRYFLQAEQELDPALFQLMKMGQGETPAIDQWLKSQGKKIIFATDPKVMSIGQAQKISAALAENQGKLLPIEENLIDAIWEDRPAMPQAPVRLQPEKYAGESATEKLSRVREALKSAGADALVITNLDAIAWLFNIRGNDVKYNPLVISYAIVTPKSASLFVDLHKINATDQNYFSKIAVTVFPYEDFKKHLHQLKGVVWADPAIGNFWVAQQLKSTQLYLAPLPITMMKALKNPVEQEGMREAHRLDGVAVVKFLHWLENHWQEGVTEISAADRLKAFREEEPTLLDLSFSTIPGFAAHGAIVHYFPTPETDIKIDNRSIFLIDSGGQYPCGTTDITRTIHLGQPTEQQKHHYTLVLKGHLALGHTAFPDGMCGEHLNALAHQFLWNEGLDYGHGTGHGVGCYLCVHEGPIAITHRVTGVPLKPGMVLSNEPGFYLKDQYGIRIENLCLVTEKFKPKDSLSGHGPFYQFEDLTLVPYCRRLINKADLTAQEIQWINDYHQEVYKTLSKRLSSEEVKKWLAAETAPL